MFGSRLNCWLVAMCIWLSSRGYSVIGIRRSVSLGGMIPHFLVIRERGLWLTVIDYIPRYRKESLFGRGNSALLFNGMYRIRRYRIVASGIGASQESAIQRLRKRVKA